MPIPNVLNSAETEWFKKYAFGKKDGLDKLIPGFPSNITDFLNRWEAIETAYERIKYTEDLALIIKELNGVKLFLEVESSKPLTFLGPVKGPDGTTATMWISRDKRIDTFFNERVLTVIKQSITDLENLQQLFPDASMSTQSIKQQNFLDEIAKIERGIGSSGTFLNPKVYAPISTLWASLSEKDICEAREFYREEVKNQIGFAKNEVLNYLLNDYTNAVKKQPDKQSLILTEHRDAYVNRLSEIYAPIQNWFYSYWDEERQVVKSVADVEMEVFHFCHGQNRSFWVGRTLLHRLYGYCLAIEHFNKMIPVTSTEPMNEGAAGKNKRINTEAKARHAAILSKYDKYRKENHTKHSAIKKLIFDFRLEYSQNDPEHRKKTIQRIIRNNRPE